MKIFLIILSGFVMTLATYAGGVVTAIFFLNAEPVPVRSPARDSAGVWTSEPVAVKTATQEYERLPARPVPEQDVAQASAGSETPEAADDLDSLIDPTTTAAISPDAADEPEIQPEPEPELNAASALNPAHVEWCSERYRSYRPETNSYTAYSGGQRECVSPFSDGAGGAEPVDGYVEASVDRPFVGYAIEDEEPEWNFSSDHVESCFARYRSYRPEDNTYQPYGGGPRRQCR